MTTLTTAKLFDTLTSVWKEDRPFVVYTFPGQNEVHACVQHTKAVIPSGSLDRKGFVFEPFHEGHPGVLIPSDEEYTALYDPESPELKPVAVLKEDRPEGHINLIRRALEALRTGVLEKVVLSRRITLPDPGKAPFEVFQNLLQGYPGAFRYLWHHPGVGTWLGATPETLLRVRNGEVQTMSLAGTQPYKGTLEVEWGAKEKEEQAMVTRSILENMAPHVAEVTAGNTSTVKAGNLLHLLTPIRATLRAGESPLVNIVKVLHPTPAVCGLPRETAKAFILDHEGYDRKYYTGYLGPVDPGYRTDLFVNLRCMEMSGMQYHLYVGGGITRDSDPQAEWEETVNKSATMRSVL
ncbi:chorismate-binding protein [Robertkochia flava]|uniref:chorismate-binding protein n=1 Tax=Robertkochia flava TaxID=3447986 RepID=UPI001CCD50B2|nr:chorismate-binding protein [Robertkochia marina]